MIIMPQLIQMEKVIIMMIENSCYVQKRCTISDDNGNAREEDAHMAITFITTNMTMIL